MTVANVRSEWSSGDLIFKDAAAGTNLFAFRTSTDGILFYDDSKLAFGDADDVTLVWDGSDFIMASLAAASDWVIGATDHVINMTVVGQLAVTPIRITGQYAYGVQIDGDEFFFTGGADTKSNLVDIQGERPAGTTPTGDSYDAVLKIAGTNYADSAGYIMRGLNGKVSNGDEGSMALIEHNLSVNGKAGSTTLTVRGLTITAENYGTCATEFGGLDIVLKNEGAVATTEYGLRIRNLNNSIADAVAAAILVSDTGANTGWDYGLDLGGASVVVGDIRFNNNLVFVALASAITATSTDTTTPAGSIGITSNGTGVGKLFVSDGSKWQFMAVA